MARTNIKIMQIMHSIPWSEANVKELRTYSTTSEDALQMVVFKYLRAMHPDVVAFAIPNGSHKSVQARVLFQLTGLMAGAADIFIAKPSSGFSGLFLELQNGKSGKVSQVQIDFSKRVEAAGYKFALAKTLDEAINHITTYLYEVFDHTT